MWILAYFTRDGEPAAGLAPLVKVRDVETGDIVIDNASMLERGDGFYGYDFSAYNPQRDYAVICDSVTLSGTERYTYASSGEYNEVLDTIESTVGIVDIRTTLLRKIQTNRLELFDGDTDNWILYDDDALTPLLTFSVSDKNGDIIVQCPSTPSKRSGVAGVSGVLSPDIYMRKSVYDPDDDGCINCAENVSDGAYTSTASGIWNAVDLSHQPCILGTKCIDESTIGDGQYIKYNASLDRLEYGIPGISGTISGSFYTKTEIDTLLGENKSDKEHLNIGDSSTSVSFASPFSDSGYVLVISLENEVDIPSSEYAVTITETTVSGFKVNYSGDIDSDNYYLNWYATLSGGLANTDAISLVYSDKSPELGGDLNLGEHNLVLNTTPSGEVRHGYTVGWSGEISAMYIDWNDNGIGTPLHMKSNGHWEQCTAASGSARMPCGALALEEGTGFKKILWKGIARKGSWGWPPGKVIYVSTVDGALTSSEPTVSGSWVQAIGLAIASDIIRFDPGFNPGMINY
jgi:hypothetical protein